MEISCPEEARNFIAEMHGITLEDIDSILTIDAQYTCSSSAFSRLGQCCTDIIETAYIIRELNDEDFDAKIEAAIPLDSIIEAPEMFWSCSPHILLRVREDHWVISGDCFRIDRTGIFGCNMRGNAGHQNCETSVLMATVAGCGNPCRLS
jgi:hypothetical protein